MRIVLTCLGLLLSVVSAQADRVVASGVPAAALSGFCYHLLYVWCRAVMWVWTSRRMAVSRFARLGVFPNFNSSNPRSACNRRRVPGVQAIYVSQRGYLGPDLVVLQVLFPNGRGFNVTAAIRVL